MQSHSLLETFQTCLEKIDLTQAMTELAETLL